MENFKPHTQENKSEKHAYNVLYLLKEIQKDSFSALLLNNAFNMEGLPEVSDFADRQTSDLVGIFSEETLRDVREKLALFMEPSQTEDEKKTLAREIASLFT
jgi:hypothetical protein